MKDVPAIGAAKGIFDIFIPGMFLLLNLILILYLSPLIGDAMKKQINNLISNQLISLSLIICFGYLLGVILRIWRVDYTDSWSGKYLINSVIRRHIRKGIHYVVSIKYYPVFDISLLFSASQEFQTELDEKTISDRLRQKFTANKITLSQNAIASIEEIGNTWQIKDGQQVYIIKKEEDKLNIYDNSNCSELLENLKLLEDLKEELKNKGFDEYTNFGSITFRCKKKMRKWSGKSDQIKYVAMIGNNRMDIYVKKGKWRTRRREEKNDPEALQRRIDFHQYAYEPFPYIGWLRIICERDLPKEALEFYDKIWADKQSRLFFNFCKTMITSADERLAGEIYSAEALTRYISSIFYALCVSFVLILINFLYRLISEVSLAYLFSKEGILYYSRIFLSDDVTRILIIILILYGFVIWSILKNFRFIRIKEVSTVFIASFKNRQIFSKSKITNLSKSYQKNTKPVDATDGEDFTNR